MFVQKKNTHTGIQTICLLELQVQTHGHVCIALLSVTLPVLLSGVFEGCQPLLRDLSDDISFSKVPLPKKEYHPQNPGNLIRPLVDWMSGSRRFCPLK